MLILVHKIGKQKTPFYVFAVALPHHQDLLLLPLPTPTPNHLMRILLPLLTNQMMAHGLVAFLIIIKLRNHLILKRQLMPVTLNHLKLTLMYRRVFHQPNIIDIENPAEQLGEGRADIN